MKFKNTSNFTFTKASSITSGAFGWGLPVKIELLSKHKPRLEGGEYIWKFTYYKTLYEIFTPADNVIEEN